MGSFSGWEQKERRKKIQTICKLIGKKLCRFRSGNRFPLAIAHQNHRLGQEVKNFDFIFYYEVFMSYTVVQGNRLAIGQKHCFLVSRFNEFITEKLLQGALDAILAHGGDLENVTVVYIPGAYEFPMTVAKLLDSRKYDAITCLGCVIRGATVHFEYVASEASRIGRLGEEFRVPVIFGILTTESIEQAIERAGSKAGNKGFEACVTAIEMVNLFKEI